MSTFKEQGIDSYPLSWPMGTKRSFNRQKSKFTTSFERARVQLFNELKLLGVHSWNVILSTDIPLRKDGMPYANLANPSDPGVAVYFRLNEKPMVFACDKFTKVYDNLYAITLTIEALRGIKRWGSSDMMERSFTGFAALPPPMATKPKRPWYQVLGYDHPCASITLVDIAYKELAMKLHPDRGGSAEAMAELNNAREEGLKHAR